MHQHLTSAMRGTYSTLHIDKP